MESAGWVDLHERTLECGEVDSHAGDRVDRGAPLRLVHQEDTVAVAGRDAPGNPPCGRGGPAFPGRQLPPATPRSWLSLTGRFPRTQAPATHPELTNQAAPARLSRGRSPARPFTYPDNPRKGNGNTPESPQQQTPTTGHTDRETPPSGKPQPPIKSRRHTQQPTPPPHKPPTHTNKQATLCRGAALWLRK